ncbi:hypothetical protein HK101_001580 [Irineochytrium annulatum]|nr:hypothetical protein HK101_001580 [Irineochytrium annulatum]
MTAPIVPIPAQAVAPNPAKPSLPLVAASVFLFYATHFYLSSLEPVIFSDARHAADDDDTPPRPPPHHAHPLNASSLIEVLPELNLAKYTVYLLGDSIRSMLLSVMGSSILLQLVILFLPPTSRPAWCVRVGPLVQGAVGVLEMAAVWWLLHGGGGKDDWDEWRRTALWGAVELKKVVRFCLVPWLAVEFVYGYIVAVSTKKVEREKEWKEAELNAAMATMGAKPALGATPPVRPKGLMPINDLKAGSETVPGKKKQKESAKKRRG